MSRYLAEHGRPADKCKFVGYLDEALHDHFVCSLHSKIIQRRLLEITYATETASQKVSMFQTTVEPKVSGKIMVIPSTKALCYRYNKVGYSPDSCYFHKQRAGYTGKLAT